MNPRKSPAPIPFRVPGAVPTLAGILAIVTSVGILTNPATAGEEVLVDGVLHIRNGNTPPQGVETLQLKELWRAGGEDDEDVLFGIIGQVQVDDDGNIYLLDQQLSDVKVYSPDGEFLKTLSREGDGPGEIRSPNDMIFMPDGTLGLVQQFPGKIIKVDLEGTPAGEFLPGGADPTSGGFMALADAKSGGGNLVLGGVAISVDTEAQAQNRNCFVASFDPDGKELVRYQELNYRWAAPAVTLKEWQMLYLWRRWNVGPNGRVLIPPVHEEYRINVYNPDGSLDRVIEREFAGWPRGGGEPSVTQTIMEAIQRGIERQGLPDVKAELEEVEPAVYRINVDDQGMIWVLSSRGFREQPEGIFSTYDVFDPSGHFQRQVAVACEGDSVKDGLFFCGKDKMILVTGFVDALVAAMGGGAAEVEEEEEAAPMEVICFKII